VTLDVQPRHSADLCIPAEHPALPGHFPGNPVVPGVVLLDAVMDAAESFLGSHVGLRGVPHAKFPASLRPGEAARIDFLVDGETLKFEVSRGTAVVASGRFQLARKSAP
jgi:3-hydroxyacyl-[acyl-carrier-protein] dehydratase